MQHNNKRNRCLVGNGQMAMSMQAKLLVAIVCLASTSVAQSDLISIDGTLAGDDLLATDSTGQ